VASAAEISAIVQRLGAEISDAYPGGAVLVAVMRGSIPFVADLARAISSPVALDFLDISAYSPGTGRVRVTKDLDRDVQGRDVLLVEDLVDTGLTLNYVMTELAGRAPRSLAACALLDRARRRLVPVELRFVGLEIDDDLVLGYGLEHGGIYANARSLYAADLHRLHTDPRAYVGQLFPAPYAE
jgi:hypoxanthine phosphoribosyltransferase